MRRRDAPMPHYNSITTLVSAILSPEHHASIVFGPFWQVTPVAE